MLSLSWKFGDCASTVATQLFFHGTPHLVFICLHYSVQIQQICNSGNSDSAHRLMFDNNLLHDVISHDRTWFCQISKYRTGGFTWQAEFDTCNAKSFQLLSRVCNGTTGSSVLLRISCVKLVAYKKKKKRKKSAFQIARLCFHQSCNYSNSCSTQEHTYTFISSWL